MDKKLISFRISLNCNYLQPTLSNLFTTSSYDKYECQNLPSEAASSKFRYKPTYTDRLFTCVLSNMRIESRNSEEMRSTTGAGKYRHSNWRCFIINTHSSYTPTSNLLRYSNQPLISAGVQRSPKIKKYKSYRALLNILTMFKHIVVR
jgi:hypothetical protein